MPSRSTRPKRGWLFAIVWIGLAPWPVHARPQTGDGVVRFVHVDAAAKSVHLVGDFNGWSPTATPLDRESDGVWAALVFLDPGTYEYKFFVDGQWQLDADNPEVSENGNSVVRVGANGAVLPMGAGGQSSAAAAGGATPDHDLRWFVRYLGYLTARRQPELQRWDLVRPLHDVDLRLEVDFGDDLSAWFRTNFNTSESDDDLSGTRLRYDRGVLLWRPQEFEIRMFDNEGVTDFEDPGVLVGKIGIYEDSFGFTRRGVLLRRRLLGAPLEFLYADNTEAASDSVLAPVLPDLQTPPTMGTQFESYAALDTRRNSDTFAFRMRGGSETRGLGFGYRFDRGLAPGEQNDLEVQQDGQGLFATGQQIETTESWNAWNVDLRLPWLGVQWMAEYMSGTRKAVAERQQVLEEARYDSSTGNVEARFGPETEASGTFALDDSRRLVWTLAPVVEHADWRPHLRYEYQEHDADARITGTPFSMRRHAAALGLGARVAGFEATLDVQQDWFDYPAGTTWETQFWFRRHNPWLDQSTATYPRFVLLGADRASFARLDVSRTLWAAHALDGELRFTWASPGFDRAPRALEAVARFSIDVADGLQLRTHSRFATFRRFETSDAAIVAQLGPGKHIEAGSLATTDIPGATHDYRTFGAHFVELVMALSERSDIALGFGVDPNVLYAVRNTYMDIGWDQFLFDAGASPQAAFADPIGLGSRIERAEHDLELERRITLEARISF